MKDIQEEIAGIFADERERIENIEANMNERVTTAYDLGYNDGWNAAFNTIKENLEMEEGSSLWKTN